MAKLSPERGSHLPRVTEQVRECLSHLSADLKMGVEGSAPCPGTLESAPLG